MYISPFLACLCFGFSIVVWNIESKEAICGSPASAQNSGHCFAIEFTNLNDEVFVSAGRFVRPFSIMMHTLSHIK